MYHLRLGETPWSPVPLFSRLVASCWVWRRTSGWEVEGDFGEWVRAPDAPHQKSTERWCEIIIERILSALLLDGAGGHGILPHCVFSTFQEAQSKDTQGIHV